MLLRAALPPQKKAIAALPVASVIVLTAYCQLWASFGEGVPVSASLEWAAINTAAFGLFALGLWMSRGRIFNWLEDGRARSLATVTAVVFAALLCAALAATLTSSAAWCGAVSFCGLYKRVVSLAPLLVVSTAAVIAIFCAALWRLRTLRPREPHQASAGPWIELPEAPLLRLRPSDVGVIRTARNYCEIDVAGRPVLVRITAKELEQRLAYLGFVRVHRGAIVNLARVRVVEPGRSGRLRILLDDGSELAVSKGHREPFTRHLSGTTRTQFPQHRAA